jgi:hypothetical protein
MREKLTGHAMRGDNEELTGQADKLTGHAMREKLTGHAMRGDNEELTGQADRTS